MRCFGSSFRASCRWDAALELKPCMSHSPISRSVCLQTQSMAKDRSTHMRSVSAQASLYSSKENLCLSSQCGQSRIEAACHGVSSASSALYQPMQAASGFCRTSSSAQQQAERRYHHTEAVEKTSACDMNRKIQQCQRFLKSRMDAHNSGSHGRVASNRHPPSNLWPIDLAVPDMRVKLKGLRTRDECAHSPPTRQRAISDGIGQLKQYEPPPALVTAATSSGLHGTISALSALRSHVEEPSCLRLGSQLNAAAPRSCSTSSDGPILASTSCSTDRCGMS